MYLTRTPWWLKKIYPGFVWDMPPEEKVIYLTFDDGPHPAITTFVLGLLKEYNAKATFFCIGKNVLLYPEVYQRILDEGHSVGNHTQHHVNGWKAASEEYIADVATAAEIIQSQLFRPPYGRIKRFQAKLLQRAGYHIVMWSVLSGDFDKQLSNEKCLSNVLLQTQEGSIVVFHDSEKAGEKLEYTLPKVLAHFSKQGFEFKEITI